MPATSKSNDISRALYELSTGPDGDALQVSFEFFPPQSDQMRQSLERTVPDLVRLNPRFVSCTYGANGATREPTLNTVIWLQEKHALRAASHFTCVGATRDDIDNELDRFMEKGVQEFVVLRGDPREGVGRRYQPHPGGFQSTAELVAHVKDKGAKMISVSAYPEKHPESIDVDADIEVLKAKADAGANQALTQFFYDNDAFIRYLEKVRQKGVKIPVIPGILPVHNFAQMSNFSSKCGTKIPAWLSARFENIEHEEKSVQSMLAVAVSTLQIRDLMIRADIKEVHFYSMNRAALVMAICRALGRKVNSLPLHQ